MHNENFGYIYISKMAKRKEPKMAPTENMKRGVYIVESYDGKIHKMYHNFKSAYKYANKLASNEIWCSLYEATENGLVEIASC